MPQTTIYKLLKVDPQNPDVAELNEAAAQGWDIHTVGNYMILLERKLTSKEKTEAQEKEE